MRGNDLDREAKLRRFINGLRQDCIRLGLDRDLVERWDLETLLERRERELRRLMNEPPGGTR